MFKGYMNTLYQHLIVSDRKVVMVYFSRISRLKFAFTASCSSFESFKKTTKIIKRTP
jgi:hypothetical protein